MAPVFYLLGKDLVLSGLGWAPASSELKSLDLASGNTVSVLPDVLIRDFDLSRDGKEVAFTSRNPGEEPRIWLASLDRRSPPRLMAKNGDHVSFGADGELVFRSLEGTTNALVRIKTDGGLPERLPIPVLDKFGVSPDGRVGHRVLSRSWSRQRRSRGGRAAQRRGGEDHLRPVHGGMVIRWKILLCERGSRDARDSGGTDSRDTAVTRNSDSGLSARRPRVQRGRDESAWRSHDRSGRLVPGSSPSVYPFQRLDLHRNLFKIPLH